MSLYYENSANVFSVWSGERLANGALYPAAIESSWTDEELAEIKFYRPIPDNTATPEGKILGSTTVQRVNGQVRFVKNFVDVPTLQVPSEVTMRQAKIGLSRGGYLPTVNDAIAGIAGQEGEEARIEWEYAATLRRDHPLVLSLGNILGLSSNQIDRLFIAAAKI